MMLKLLLSFQNHENFEILKKRSKNNKGSTLLELLLGLAISAIIVLTFYSILTFTNKAYKYGSMENEVLSNGRYAMEYIKRDIKTADKIIAIDRIEELEKQFHKDNIGFVVMKDNRTIKDRYNFSTYYLKDNKLRLIANNRSISKYPPCRAFDGHNVIAEHVLSIEATNIDWEKGLITLSLTLGEENGKKVKLETKIKIQCPIDY